MPEVEKKKVIRYILELIQWAKWFWRKMNGIALEILLP